MKLIRIIWRSFWSAIWAASEMFGVPLGNAAPWIFGQAIGCKFKEAKP